MFSGCSVKMQCEDAVCGCIQVIMPWWVCVVAVQGWSSVSVSGVLVSGIIMRLYLYQHDYSLVSSVLYTYPLFSQCRCLWRVMPRSPMWCRRRVKCCPCWPH